jgi:hypothetical protein
LPLAMLAGLAPGLGPESAREMAELAAARWQCMKLCGLFGACAGGPGAVRQ